MNRSDRNELLNRLVISQIPRPVPKVREGFGSISLFRCAEPQNSQTGSGMYHPIVKEQVLPGQLEGQQTNADNSEARAPSQRFFYLIVRRLGSENCDQRSVTGGSLEQKCPRARSESHYIAELTKPTLHSARLAGVRLDALLRWHYGQRLVQIPLTTTVSRRSEFLAAKQRTPISRIAKS